LSVFVIILITFVIFRSKL